MSEHREKAVEAVRSALAEQEFDFDGLPSRDGLADALQARRTIDAALSKAQQLMEEGG